MSSTLPTEVVQRQLDAYNAKDVEGWVSTYAPDAEQYMLHGARLAVGREEIRSRVLSRFAEPDLFARLLTRAVMGNFVVDHELITRNFPEGKGTIEMLCVYEVIDGLIQTASFSFGEKLLGVERHVADLPASRADLSPFIRTVLVPMSPEVFTAYLEFSVADYAEDNIASGRWPAEGAIGRSRAEFHRLLPKGLATPENYLYEIKASDAGPSVGSIWFAVVERHGIRGAFIYDLGVNENHRRLGHARRALQALEPLVAALGLSTVGLHVFGQNAGAQALYRQLGYNVTGMNMLKKLGRGGQT